MSEGELKAIMIDNAEAVISLEEKLVKTMYENINKKRQILNMMRELPLEDCIKYMKGILPVELEIPLLEYTQIHQIEVL